MNEETQLQIIELMDDGATLESSPELNQLVEASEEATKFYESLIVSESMLEGFFGGEKAKDLNNRIESFIDEQLEKPSKISSINFRPVMGFAVAASLAFVAITFLNSPSQLVQPVVPIQIAYEEPLTVPVEELIVEEPEPRFVSGSEMETLWSTSVRIANNLGVDKYKVMYALHEANKDFFVDSNINAPRADRDYFIDLSIIESVDVAFASNEVKRRIFCNC